MTYTYNINSAEQPCIYFPHFSSMYSLCFMLLSNCCLW